MMRWSASPAPQGSDGRYFGGHHSMMWSMGNNSGALWFFGILWLITWILVIVVLVALVRWLWKKGDEEKTRRPRR